jgi:hypothetical protein
VIGEPRRVDQGYCPACKKRLTGATGATGDHGPRPGDVSVCLYCGEVLIYGKYLRVRRPTPAELMELRNDPANWATVCHLQQHFRKARKALN